MRRLIGFLALVVIVALLVVGVASDGIARHALQGLPVWPAAAWELTRSPAAKWLALPVFLFWLAIMTLIWPFLLHIADIANGTYGPGIGPGYALSIFVTIAALQIGAMAVSLRPPIASDSALLS